MPGKPRLSTAEAAELSRSVRAVCDTYAEPARVRKVVYSDDEQPQLAQFDTRLWHVLCTQIGITAIAAPESLGGGGFGATALGVVAHELGRALAPVPFLSNTVLAAALLGELYAGSPRAKEVLTGLIDGEQTAAAVLTGDGGRWQSRMTAMTAHQTGGKWNVSGTARHVLGAANADNLLIAADTEAGLGLFLVDPSRVGLTVTAERVLDRTRPMATVTCSDTAATLLSGSSHEANDIVSRSYELALAVLSAEQVGACERLLEIASAYAGARVQFGRLIGSFQAIKHKCADMLIALEWARSASEAALSAIDDASIAASERRWRASMAKAVCSESLRDAAHACVQIHGGIGFTWEGPAHLYLRRARTDEVLLGGPGVHWDQLAADAPIRAAGIREPGDSIDPMRKKIREFLRSAPRPEGLHNYGPTPTADDVAPGRAWHAYLAEHGYACLHWPAEFGGADASVSEQAVFAEECAHADVPRQLAIAGVDIVGPVLIRHGTAEQKARYLEPIRRGDALWTQLFSEPGAGSDLAAIRTRAQPIDSGWRVDGQKVWSSAAASAEYGLLLARTGAESHRGLSMFIVPMNAPGVTVRPLLQIDGESKFNEVFLDGVELSADGLIGEVGQGWQIAMLTLGRERLTLGSQSVAMFRLLEDMVTAAENRTLLGPVLTRTVTRLWTRMWLLRFTWERAVAGGDTNSPAFSVLKLMTSEADRDLGDLATEVLGTDACADPADNHLVRHMLVGRAQTILGGTSEIQRNILGERVLGLPKEPR